MTHPYLTEGRNNLLATMVNERFEENDDAGRAPFRAAWHQINKAATFDEAKRLFDETFQALKAVPTLAARQAAQPRIPAAVVDEVGYYRNPDDGTLYRLVERKDGHKTVLRVAVYSKTGGPRRLSVEGNLVKGKWVQKGKFDSARLRRAIKVEWKISEEGLLEFAYGFCPLHGGPLADGVSVALGYGPKCAENNGLPWNEAAARAVLEAQGIDADEFFQQHAGEVQG